MELFLQTSKRGKQVEIRLKSNTSSIHTHNCTAIPYPDRSSLPTARNLGKLRKCSHRIRCDYIHGHEQQTSKHRLTYSNRKGSARAHAISDTIEIHHLPREKSFFNKNQFLPHFRRFWTQYEMIFNAFLTILFLTNGKPSIYYRIATISVTVTQYLVIKIRMFGAEKPYSLNLLQNLYRNEVRKLRKRGSQ